MADIGNLATGNEIEGGNLRVKVICVGDSAVGKSKLVERFLSRQYTPLGMSTYALTLYRYATTVENETVVVDFWDTAGQEKFDSVHPSYYNQAHAAILVFDATRKMTYRNLGKWYAELRQFRPSIPVICAVNKIDANTEVTGRSFAFALKNSIPLYYVSALDGTNVLKLFCDAIQAAVQYKKSGTDFHDIVLKELALM